MAATCTLDRPSGGANFTSDYQDSIPLRYIVKFDSEQNDQLGVFIAAQTLGPHPLPPRRASYPYQPYTPYFAKSFSINPSSDSLKQWHIDVTFGPPDKGEDSSGQQQQNPLLRPAIYNIEHIESEYVIQTAKNVTALSHGDGNGGNRAANTLGPIVNAAGRRPDEPLVDTERNAVLVITRNYANLAALESLNEEYQRTTNSDTVQGFDPRRLKYQVTDSQGLQIENDYQFYTGVTRIEVKKTTDLTIDNVGYEYYDVANSKFVRAKDGDGEFVADPINLKTDGDKGGTTTTTLTFRHLEEVDYAGLF